MDISRISNINDIQPKNIVKKNKAIESFDKILNEALNETNKLQLDSQEKKKLLAIGEIDNVHEVTVAAAKADVALQFTLTVKNKIIDAYKEIMRMPV